MKKTIILLAFSLCFSISGTLHMPQIITDADKAGRIKYAQEVKTNLINFKESFSELADNDNNWVIHEVEAYLKYKNLERYISVRQDSRYLVWSAKQTMTNFIALMDNVISAKTTNVEMYYWSVFVESLLNFNAWADIWKLYETGVIKFDGYTNTDISQTQMLYVFNSTNGSITASQVMNHIITPYLFSEATKKKN